MCHISQIYWENFVHFGHFYEIRIMMDFYELHCVLGADGFNNFDNDFALKNQNLIPMFIETVTFDKKMKF